MLIVFFSYLFKYFCISSSGTRLPPVAQQICVALFILSSKLLSFRYCKDSSWLNSPTAPAIEAQDEGSILISSSLSKSLKWSNNSSSSQVITPDNKVCKFSPENLDGLATDRPSASVMPSIPRS